MTATAGVLGEGHWVVGRLRPLVRCEEGRPDRGMPRLGGHDRRRRTAPALPGGDQMPESTCG